MLKPVLFGLMIWGSLMLAGRQDQPKVPERSFPTPKPEMSGKLLEKLHEPELTELNKDANAEVYRVMIFPTWGNLVLVRVQRHGELYSLSARRLDGQAGFETGKLIESKDVELNGEDSKTLETLIANLNFFQFAADDKVIGTDGDEWTIEGVSRGKYHIAERWCAADYNPAKRGLKPFLALCKFLVDKSKLSQRPSNRGRKLI